MPRRYKVFLWVGTITLILDQITKYWARRLPTDSRGYGKPVEVIENFWDWQLSYNTGSAFGLFSSTSGARVFLTIIGFVAVGAIVWMLVKARDDQKWFNLALALVAGGAVGNIVDRIAFGKVTDFVVWKYYDSRWPTFNVADAALCIGVGLLLLSEIKKEGRDPEEDDEDPDDDDE